MTRPTNAAQDATFAVAESASPSAAIHTRPEGAIMVVAAVPRGGVNRVGPIDGDAVRVRVTAAAVDGAANAAIVRLLASELDLPKSRVRVVAGHCARRKRVLFEGVDADELSRRLSRALLDRPPGG